MGRLTGDFWRQFRQWERINQASFVLALVLLACCALAVAFGSAPVRTPALIGGFGLIVVIQLIFMWANRGMLTAYTQAQRLYLAEDFESACTILESLRQTGKADVRALTLLGNAYRQRALLDESAAVLLEALNIQPNHYFPLYGFGRTLLIQGRFDEAASLIEKALTAGAPPVVRLDAGEAYYRGGQLDDTLRVIKPGLDHADEPHRKLMGRYLLYRIDGQPPPEPMLIEAGLPYWRAQAERYHSTVYGQLLAEDIQVMQTLADPI